jgi:hypothetical protein
VSHLFITFSSHPEAAPELSIRSQGSISAVPHIAIYGAGNAQVVQFNVGQISEHCLRQFNGGMRASDAIGAQDRQG